MTALQVKFQQLRQSPCETLLGIDLDPGRPVYSCCDAVSVQLTCVPLLPHAFLFQSSRLQRMAVEITAYDCYRYYEVVRLVRIELAVVAVLLASTG